MKAGISISQNPPFGSNNAAPRLTQKSMTTVRRAQMLADVCGCCMNPSFDFARIIF